MTPRKATDNKGDTDSSDEWDLPDLTDSERAGDQDAPSAPPVAQEGPDGAPGAPEAPTPVLDKLRVESTTHVTLENEVINPGRKLAVNDTAEARNCIAVGFLRLLDDDEELDEQ